MNKLNTLDEYLFRLINSNGWQQMDDIMIMISSKIHMDSFYIFLFFIIYSNYTKKIYIKYYFH